MEDFVSAVRAHEPLARWADDLAAFATGIDVALPDGDAFVEAILDLAVPHPDVNELVATRAALARDPHAWTLFERAVRAMVAGVGTVGRSVATPALPEETGALGRWFHVLVFLACRPHVLAHHREHGVGRDVSRRTLADLGRHVAVHRRRYGVGGLVARHWIGLHFRGEIYQLGRLQFQRSTVLGRVARDAGAAGLPYAPDDPALSLHIPSFHGPLDEAACDASLALAREFFPRHFPAEDYRVATCESWLLDPQLRDLLPARSNILRFQERFRVTAAAPEPDADDASTIGFVFGDPDLPVSALPRRTSLERAVHDHLRDGGHFHNRTGWFEL